MKSVFGISTRGIVAMAASATLAVGMCGTVFAQAAVAKIHGTATNPAGFPYNHGEVKLTADKRSDPKDRTYPYVFPIGANGSFSGDNIPPGDYVAVLALDGKTPDFQELTLKTGDDKVLTFDLSRPEYIASMTPEERTALEEYKKKNAAATAENSKIADINATLKQARLDEKNGKTAEAVKALTQLSVQKADESIIWASLGEAQLADADASLAAAKAAKTSLKDPAIIQKYADSAASYQKAIDLNATSKKPSPETVSASYMNMGSALAKEGKLNEAAAAYEASVKALPSSAASAYYNEAATFFNGGTPEDLAQAAVAADKGIQADPKRPLLYYIKGASLVGKATMDPKTQKFVTPPGCIEAYQEYLELDPTGVHAAEVKELLVAFGQPVKNSFKQGKK